MAIIYIMAALIFIFFMEHRNAVKREKALTEKLKKQWGKPVEREISSKEYENISHFFKNSELSDYIDDITWHDLDMDRVFKKISNTNSSVGREYLYRLLRTPVFNNDELKRRDKLMEAVASDENGRTELQRLFSRLGFCRKYSLSDYMEFLKNAVSDSNTVHYAGITAFIISLLYMVLVNPTIGLVAVFIVLGVNIVGYYRCKSKIEPFFVCIKYVAAMSGCCSKMYALNLDYLNNDELLSYGKMFEKDARRLKLISSGSDYNGSLMDTLLDYVRMITHIDIIMYNGIISDFKYKQNEIEKMMELLGFIEAMTAAASYRKSLSVWTKPVLSSAGHCFIKAEKIYHPLIENPVANSINTDNCVLITGSNASGKSTFLRTVAINSILAQTIFTCTASSYESSFFRLYSSMSLKDDLINGESYYMVEIKSILRVLKACENDIPVLCFVDEVLRGTNTVERIAASTQILLNLKKQGALCFAATHDIELTRLLESSYDNYHFEETVTDDDISFNFRLLDGPAVTRNAIKLLKLLQYDDEIVLNAEKMAQNFLNTGNWEL